MITRYLSAVASGTLMTFAILFAMQGLIKLQPGADSNFQHVPLDFHALPDIREEPPQRIEHRFELRELTRTLTPPSERPTLQGPGKHGIPINSGGPGEVPDIPIRPGQPDGPLIAIVRVQPTYPPPAEQRGLEGWVDVRFDVLPNGLTSNVEVLRSSNRMFERAAVKAAERFRYKAPVVNGVPQRATGIEFRFRFTMNE